MRRRRTVVAVLVLAGLAAGCGDVAGPTPDTPPPTVATTAPSDGLDCPDDSRTATILEPVEGFAGHATPQEAVLSIAAAVSVTGTAVNVAGDDWVVRSEAGLAMGRATVERWGEGWFAGEIVTCGSGS